MTTPYTPDGLTYHSSVNLPDDGDLSNSTKLAAVCEELADNAAYAHAHGLIQRVHAVPGSEVNFNTQSDTYVDVTGVVATVTGMAVGDQVDFFFNPLVLFASAAAVNGTVKFLIQQSGVSDVYFEYALPVGDGLGIGARLVVSPSVSISSANTNNMVGKVQIKVENTAGYAYCYAPANIQVIRANQWR